MTATSVSPVRKYQIIHPTAGIVYHSYHLFTTHITDKIVLAPTIFAMKFRNGYFFFSGFEQDLFVEEINDEKVSQTTRFENEYSPLVYIYYCKRWEQSLSYML